MTTTKTASQKAREDLRKGKRRTFTNKELTISVVAIENDIAKILHNTDWGNGAFKAMFDGILTNLKNWVMRKPKTAVPILFALVYGTHPYILAIINDLLHQHRDALLVQWALSAIGL